MRRGNASLINENRKKARRNDQCQFWMTLVFILGLKIHVCYVVMFIFMTIVRLILA